MYYYTQSSSSYRVNALKNGNTSLEIDLPGYSNKEVDVSIESEKLTVIAKNEKRGEQDMCFRLHPDVKQEDVSAKLEGGVLTIELSLKETSKKRKVEVR